MTTVEIQTARITAQKSAENFEAKEMEPIGTRVSKGLKFIVKSESPAERKVDSYSSYSFSSSSSKKVSKHTTSSETQLYNTRYENSVISRAVEEERAMNEESAKIVGELSSKYKKLVDECCNEKEHQTELLRKEELDQKISSLLSLNATLRSELLKIENAEASVQGTTSSSTKASDAIVEKNEDSKHELNILNEEIAGLEKELAKLQEEKIRDDVQYHSVMSNITTKRATLKKSIQELKEENEIYREEIASQTSALQLQGGTL